MKNKINYLAIIIFYSIAIFCRYLSNKTGLLNDLSSDFLKVLLTGVGPAIGAFFVFVVFRIKPVLSLKGNYKHIAYPLFLYFVFPVLLIAGTSYFLKGVFPFETVTAILLYGLLEEIGWRGFLRQELKPLPKFLNVGVVATLWFAWHLNFDFSTGNVVFFGILLLGSWGIGQVADSTTSLLAVAAFHSLNNFFTKMGNVEVALLLVLLSVWILLLIYRKRKGAISLKGGSPTIV